MIGGALLIGPHMHNVAYDLTLAQDCKPEIFSRLRTISVVFSSTAGMEHPEALDLFATNAEIVQSLDQVRQLGIDWPKVDVLELDGDRLSL
jgi:hypothetical protein